MIRDVQLSERKIYFIVRYNFGKTFYLFEHSSSETFTSELLYLLITYLQLADI